MELSDQTITDLQHLLKQVKTGDEHALSSLLVRFQNRFYQLVRKMLWRYPHVKRWEQTDDVLQASIIRLHRSLTQTQPDSVKGLIGLAAVQTRRTLIDLARHYYGVYGHGAHHHSDAGGRATSDNGGIVERAASPPESLEDWTEFHKATERLPDEPREAFELVWYTGLTQQEAAKLIGVSRRTIIRRLNLARELLYQMLADQDRKKRDRSSLPRAGESA